MRGAVLGTPKRAAPLRPDPDPQIRQRATVAANNLRRNLQRDKTQQRVDSPPIRIGPSGEPLERR